MGDAFVFEIQGLKHLNDLETLDESIIKAARLAVNEAATRGRDGMATEVLNQVNLPPGYVSARTKRLYVSARAKGRDLQATITARARATSLARFAIDAPAKGQRKVDVAVKSGAVRTVGSKSGKGGSAWLVDIKSGADSKGNLGLAIRTPDGLPPRGAYKPKKLWPGVYLLYGPSVASVIYSENNNGGVATKLEPEILDLINDEFWQNFKGEL